MSVRRKVEFVGFSEVDGGWILTVFCPLMTLGREPVTVTSAPKPPFTFQAYSLE